MLCKRLLSFLCSLLLSAVAVGQNNKPQTTVPDSCLVTNAADRPFIPPAPYRAKPSPGQFCTAPINFGQRFRLQEHGVDCHITHLVTRTTEPSYPFGDKASTHTRNGPI